MNTLMTWTTAGFAALVNANNTGTLPVECKYIALGTGTTAATPADTALQNEIKRIETISGTIVDDNVIHVVLRDETTDTYQATEIGLIAADGTLLARYAQANPIIVKAASAVALLAIDASFTDVDVAQISFGDIEFINPPWGEDTPGVVQKSTQLQAEEGVNNSVGMTPRRTVQLINGSAAEATTAKRGTARIATEEEAIDREKNDVIMTPSLLKAVFSGPNLSFESEGGYQILPSGLCIQFIRVTANNILAGAEKTQQISFPIAFKPNSTIILQATPRVGLMDVSFSGSSRWPDGETLRLINNSNNNIEDVYINVLAIGIV